MTLDAKLRWNQHVNIKIIELRLKMEEAKLSIWEEIQTIYR